MDKIYIYIYMIMTVIEVYEVFSIRDVLRGFLMLVVFTRESVISHILFQYKIIKYSFIYVSLWLYGI